MYRILYTKQAAKDARNLKACGLEKRAKELGNLQGFCSRRINIQHRIVYQVIEEGHVYEGTAYQGYVKIVRMWTHYE